MFALDRTRLTDPLIKFIRPERLKPFGAAFFYKSRNPFIEEGEKLSYKVRGNSGFLFGKPHLFFAERNAFN